MIFRRRQPSALRMPNQTDPVLSGMRATSAPAGAVGSRSSTVMCGGLSEGDSGSMSIATSRCGPSAAWRTASQAASTLRAPGVSSTNRYARERRPVGLDPATRPAREEVGPRRQQQGTVAGQRRQDRPVGLPMGHTGHLEPGGVAGVRAIVGDGVRHGEADITHVGRAGLAVPDPDAAAGRVGAGVADVDVQRGRGHRGFAEPVRRPRPQAPESPVEHVAQDHGPDARLVAAGQVDVGVEVLPAGRRPLPDSPEGSRPDDIRTHHHRSAGTSHGRIPVDRGESRRRRETRRVIRSDAEAIFQEHGPVPALPVGIDDEQESSHEAAYRKRARGAEPFNPPQLRSGAVRRGIEFPHGQTVTGADEPEIARLVEPRTLHAEMLPLHLVAGDHLHEVYRPDDPTLGRQYGDDLPPIGPRHRMAGRGELDLSAGRSLRDDLDAKRSLVPDRVEPPLFVRQVADRRPGLARRERIDDQRFQFPIRRPASGRRRLEVPFRLAPIRRRLFPQAPGDADQLSGRRDQETLPGAARRAGDPLDLLDLVAAGDRPHRLPSPGRPDDHSSLIGKEQEPVAGQGVIDRCEAVGECVGDARQVEPARRESSGRRDRTSPCKLRRRSPAQVGGDSCPSICSQRHSSASIVAHYRHVPAGDGCGEARPLQSARIGFPSADTTTTPGQ